MMVATESEYSFCFFFVSLAIIVWLCTVWCAAFILEEFFHVKHVCVCPEGGGGGMRVGRCSARICLCFIFYFPKPAVWVATAVTLTLK